MSEFIAEAQVLVVPNTAAFRASLEAQLTAATAKPIVIPVVAEVISTGSIAATAQTEAFTVAQADAAVATEAAGAAASQAAARQAELAVAQKAAAATAREEAAAQVIQARKLGQVERGAASTALTFFGLRGATLAASGGFIAGAAGILVLTKGLKEASNQTEQLNKSREVFGAFSKDVEDFAKTSAAAIGESNAKALELVSTFGALLRPIGFTQEAAQKVSLSLTKLGADLASFFNTDVADSLSAIQSGLVGQVRPLRRYGIELSAARVNALALADTGKKVVSSLTDQEKVSARIKIIFRDSAIAQGDFARTSGEFANQTRILTAEIADLEGELGRLVIPGLTLVIRTMTTGIGIAHTLAGALGEVAGGLKAIATAAARVPKGENLLPKLPKQEAGGVGFLTGLSEQIGQAERAITDFSGLFIQSTKPVQTESEKTTAAVTKIFDAAKKTENIAKFDGAMNHLIETLQAGDPAQQKTADRLIQLKGAIDSLGTLPGAQRFASLLKEFSIDIDETAASSDQLRGGFIQLDEAARKAAGGVDVLKQALGGLKTQSAQALAELLKLQTEGGTPAQQIGVLQSDVETQRQIIEAARAAGGPGSATAIKTAREQILSDQSQISSLQAGIVADQKAAAADAKRKAKDAQDARDQQFQALADTFGARQQDIKDAIDRAGIKGNINAEIRLNKALIASLKRELDALRQRLKALQVSAKERKSILQAINRAIESAQQEQLRLTLERKQNRQQRQQDEADRRQAHLEALLEIAQTTVSTADDRARQKALIAFDQQQIRRILAIKRRRKLTADEAAQLDAYRVDLAQRNAELKKVTDESDKTKGLFFKFLQTQQGFAANLLGNLIPGFATAGLVGGSTPAAGGEGLRQVAGGFEQPRGAVASQAALASGRERGVRPVQVDTTNHLLRQILRSLQNLNGRASHPEARYQRSVANGGMDTLQ